MSMANLDRLVSLRRRPQQTAHKQCSPGAGPAHGPWAGPPMGHGLGRQWVWAGLEFLRNEGALDGPGLEF